ncbi:MAG: glycosyltransferase family 39 protein [Nitrosarchaeum sp.]
MQLAEFIESKLERLLSKPILALSIVMLLGLSLRVYFTPWHFPTESFDAFIFMIEGTDYSRGDFSNLSHRFLWPMFLSIFFLIFRFDSYFEYMTLVRVISIVISTISIPVLYLISKQFVGTKYAILATVFFAVEANLVENSIFGITEPLFILLGLVSFYFIVQKNERYLPFAFVFAGLAFDTRINGIVLILILIVLSIMKIKDKKISIKTLLISFLILFVIVAPVNLIYPILEGKSALPYVGDTITTVSKGQEYYSTSQLDGNSSSNVLQNAIKNEVMNFFRITIPYLIILFPYGIIISLKNINYEKKILFSVIVVSLIIAIPQHTISNEYRNLFFIIPFLCIFSAIAFEKLTEKTDLRNIFLVLLILGLILISANFLRERYDVDKEYFIEKDSFGKYIANNLEGNITGNIRLEIIRNMVNLKSTSYFFNERLSVFDPGFPIDSVPKLMDYCIKNKIDYLVVEHNKTEKHFPVFNSIEFNESNLSFLEKIDDSEKLGYKKLRAEVFKINYDKYVDSLN